MGAPGAEMVCLLASQVGERVVATLEASSISHFLSSHPLRERERIVNANLTDSVACLESRGE